MIDITNDTAQEVRMIAGDDLTLTAKFDGVLTFSFVKDEAPAVPARYPAEEVHGDSDDGTMPANVAELADAVVGHRIVSVDQDRGPLRITLDNGKVVTLADTDDCCAYTEIESFLLNVKSIDHIILGVGTTDSFDTWHIFADFGDVMKIQVGWSCGNPFYYGYGFSITVTDTVAE